MGLKGVFWSYPSKWTLKRVSQYSSTVSVILKQISGGKSFMECIPVHHGCSCGTTSGTCRCPCRAGPSRAWPRRRWFAVRVRILSSWHCYQSGMLPPLQSLRTTNCSLLFAVDDASVCGEDYDPCVLWASPRRPFVGHGSSRTVGDGQHSW